MENSSNFMVSKKNKKNISVCGTDCLGCLFYGKMCEGCNNSNGKVFHSPDGCRIYTCVQSKKLHNCGKCAELPCDVWRKTRDPSMTDEQFEKSIEDRVAVLKKIN